MTINRSLSRNLSIVAVGVLLVALFSVYLPVAHAAAFTVNSLSDASDAVIDGTCLTAGGVCTLRAALEESNATPAVDDTIGFSVSGTINVASQLVASDDVSISAAAIGNIRIVGSSTRNLLVGSESTQATPTVTITNLIFTGGSGSGFVGTLDSLGNPTSSNRNEGGCIFVSAGATLTLNSSVVHTCTSGSFGGGIYEDGGTAGGQFSVVNLYLSTTVRDNIAIKGAGVYAKSGTIRVQSDACVRANGEEFTTSEGGGLYGGDDTLLVVGGGEGDRGFIVNNYAASGGGVLIESNASFSGNHARFYSNRSDSTGSAWYSFGGTAGGAPNAAGRACTDCCIVNNNTNYAVFQNNTGLITNWLSNWWGNNWGPRIRDLDPGQANNQIGSAVSNGDGIRGTGLIAVNVGLVDDGNHAGTPIPTGNWDTWDPIGTTGNAPSDCRNFVCNPVSSVAPRGGTVCIAPTSCGFDDSVG